MLKKLKKKFFLIICKSKKIHVKCVLKTDKSSFEKRSLSYTFNIYFIYSPLMHKLKAYIEKYKKMLFLEIFLGP